MADWGPVNPQMTSAVAALSVAKEVKVETDQSDHGKVMSSEYLIGRSHFLSNLLPDNDLGIVKAFITGPLP